MFGIHLIWYGLVGLLSGFVGGLLGISGGLIAVPCLFLMFTIQQLPTTDLMQLAIGTSLAAMVFNAISATYAHHLQKNVKWPLVKTMLPGLIMGCIAGAFLSDLFSTVMLQIIFGVFVIAFGLYFYKHRKLPKLGPHPLLTEKRLRPVGFLVGTISNLLGIGGGTMMVPIFVGFKLPMKNAIGTSAATGFVISFVGAFAYLIFGLEETTIQYTLGYIYLPAFFILAITTFLAAPYGAKMAQRLHTDKLKKLFSLAMVVLGILMLAT